METVIVAVLAGLLAGFGTGFAGLSAAVFIAPMLITFLNVDSFSAIGIALASDVLASAISALTYRHHKNTDLKSCRLLLLAVLLSAIIGTMVSHVFTAITIGESIMGWWLVLATLALGLKLLFFPSKTEKKRKNIPGKRKRIVMLLGGAYIGFVCGFQGTGGGMMLLFVLNVLLGLDFKKAVGSSVCIMTFTALIGAVSHFSIRGLPDTKLLLLCVLFTLAGAEAAAVIANNIKALTLKRLTGGMMTAAGIAMAVSKFI